MTHYLTLFSYIDFAIAAILVLVIIFAKPLLNFILPSNLSDNKRHFRIALFRACLFTAGLIYYFRRIHEPLIASGGNAFKIIMPLVILYLAYLSNYLSQYFIHKRYGKERTIADEKTTIATYQTRLLSLIMTVFITVIALISIIKILGFDSLLEAGGILGIIGLMFALTQAAWAPDVISGLIFLNSANFEEGDVIEVENEFIGRVIKTQLFHTEILNLKNKHRIMVRNAQLRDKVIHNYSRFTSLKGLRECLTFNIGYDVPQKNILNMMNEAFSKAKEDEITFEHDTAPELKLLETGDHAVTWGIIYFTKDPYSVISTRQNITIHILNTATSHDISLGTPLTHTVRQIS